jgi:hypothetical protein
MDCRVPSRSVRCGSHCARMVRSSQLSTRVQGQLPRDHHASQQYRCGPRSSLPPSCQIAKCLDIFHGAVSCKSSVTADSVPAGVHRQVRRGRSWGRITFRPVVYRADMLLRLCGATYQPDTEHTVPISRTNVWHSTMNSHEAPQGGCAQVQPILPTGYIAVALPSAAGSREEQHGAGPCPVCRWPHRDCPRHEVPCNLPNPPDSRRPRYPHNRQQQLLRTNRSAIL